MGHADDAMSTCHATPVPVPLVNKASSPTGAHAPGHIAPTLYASPRPRCASHQDHLPLLLRSAHAPVPGVASRSAVAGQALTPESPPPSSAKPWKEGGKQTEGQAAAAEPPPSRSAAIGRAPVRGCWGREEAVHGQSAAAPVPTAVPPWGGGEEREGAASVRARCRADGGPGVVAWQPSRSRGQSSGDVVSAAALTGPRAAAQTGTPFRPRMREPVVAWTPRRPRLGGVRHGGAVHDGGVGLVARSTERPCRSRP